MSTSTWEASAFDMFGQQQVRINFLMFSRFEKIKSGMETGRVMIEYEF